MAVVQGTDEEVLPEGETLGEVATDVLKMRATSRCFGNDGVLERLAGEVNFFEREEGRGFSTVGEGGEVNL